VRWGALQLAHRAADLDVHVGQRGDRRDRDVAVLDPDVAAIVHHAMDADPSVTIEIDAAELHAVELRAGERRPANADALETGVAQVRVVEARAVEIGAAEARSAQVRA
jgi:hypothetical protein